MPKILLTGANGYIGTRLLSLLGEEGHEIVALVRSKSRLSIPPHLEKNVSVIVADLLDKESLQKIPEDIDAAYYLVHSMGQQASGFSELEINSAKNFTEALGKTKCKQVIYRFQFKLGYLTLRKPRDWIDRKGPNINNMRSLTIVQSRGISLCQMSKFELEPVYT